MKEKLTLGLLFWLSVALFGCEATETETGTEAGTNTSTRPMCEEMTAHAGAISACVSSGTLCTNESDVYGARDCLTSEIETFSTASVACESASDCAVLSYGGCGEAIAVASSQADIAAELSCRLSSCFTSLDYSLDCDVAAAPNTTTFNQPVAVCENSVCVVQDGQE